MLKLFRADLHVHTCLSPCGSLWMSPRMIVDEALRQGLDIIAVTDHNSAENCRVVAEAANGTALSVIAGVEACSREEIHLIGLFPGDAAARDVQQIIYDHLDGFNDEKTFGVQAAVEADGTIRFFEKRLLIGATSLSIESLVDVIHSVEGLAIAAHINREAFGILGQLGFLPPELDLDGLEFSAAMSIHVARERFPEFVNFSFISSSDAHYPEDIGRGWTNFMLNSSSFEELRKAFRGTAGRRIIETPDAGSFVAHS